MGERWDWVSDIRNRHFSPPLAGGYVLEAIAPGRYWALHEAELRPYFPPETHFDAPAAPERLALSPVLEDHWIVRAPGGALAGLVSTCGRDASTFELHHVNMHPDHRGRGVYREVLGRVLAYAEELGFALTVSEHSPSNNAVIISHLRAGFRLVALELNPRYGPAVRLAYFHDPELLRAYEFRCGLDARSSTR